MSILSACEWLEHTAVAVVVRESLWGFPILVGLHLMGIALSVGTLVWFDLRLLGIGLTRVAVSNVYRRLMPWAFAGFVVMFVTGGLLFSGYATAAYGNAYFRVKVIALVLAGLNALRYHLVTERTIATWDRAELPPPAARLAGGASIVLWTVVILMGRMISYTMF